MIAATHQHPAYRVGSREFVVAAAEPVTPEVRHLVLMPRDGGPVAPYQAGSHVVVDTAAGRNAYSLTGDGSTPDRYEISVLRCRDGGGSAWIHDELAPGSVVTIEGPRAMFAPRYDQRHALLVAGGIGITPILSHARYLARWGGTAEIIYSYRPGAAAHLNEIRDAGFPVHEATTVARTRELLAERFADQPLGTHAYACGPAAMLETYRELGLAAGWPESRLHLERFQLADLDPGEPFTATVRSTGARVAVAAGTSLLDALSEAGVAVASMCRQGVCGECRVGVASAASLDHRDAVLTPAERDAADSIMCCVSRGTDVEVDL